MSEAADILLARGVRTWVPTFVRAIRACRLYPESSAMRLQQVELAHKGLTELLSGQRMFSLSVREGAFYFGEEQVYSDEDDRNGPTFFLGSSSIFELTFQEGVDANELSILIYVLSEQRGFQRRGGEDLVTLLWRHSLHNIRHRWVDVLASAIKAGSAASRMRFEDSETDRLRKELSEIVESIAIDQATGHDFIALADGALETPELCRQAISKGQQIFSQAVELNERRVSKRMIEALRLDLRAASQHDALTSRLAELLIQALIAEPDPLAPSPALSLFFRLFEGMLTDRDFSGAARLIVRVRALAQGHAAFKDRATLIRAFGQGLLARLAGSATTSAAIRCLEESDDRKLGAKAIELLRALGDEGLPLVLAKIPEVENAIARELLVALVVELTAQRRGDLYQLMRTERWEVSVQILRSALSLSPAERAPLVAIGTGHSSAAVRAMSLRALTAYQRGRPDEIFARAVADGDARVRSTALRAIAARRSEIGAKQIGVLVARDDILDRDPAELRSMLMTRAAISQATAFPELERLLNKASALTRAYKGATIDAVTFALAVIDTDAAKELVNKGARSLNPRLRAACKAALDGARVELARVRAPLLDNDGAYAMETEGRAVWPAEAELELSARHRGSIDPRRPAGLSPISSRTSAPPPPRPSAPASSRLAPIPRSSRAPAFEPLPPKQPSQPAPRPPSVAPPPPREIEPPRARPESIGLVRLDDSSPSRPAIEPPPFARPESIGLTAIDTPPREFEDERATEPQRPSEEWAWSDQIPPSHPAPPRVASNQIGMLPSFEIPTAVTVPQPPAEDAPPADTDRFEPSEEFLDLEPPPGVKKP